MSTYSTTGTRYTGFAIKSLLSTLHGTLLRIWMQTVVAQFVYRVNNSSDGSCCNVIINDGGLKLGGHVHRRRSKYLCPSISSSSAGVNFYFYFFVAFRLAK